MKASSVQNVRRPLAGTPRPRGNPILQAREIHQNNDTVFFTPHLADHDGVMEFMKYLVPDLKI